MHFSESEGRKTAPSPAYPDAEEYCIINAKPFLNSLEGTMGTMNGTLEAPLLACDRKPVFQTLWTRSEQTLSGKSDTGYLVTSTPQTTISPSGISLSSLSKACADVDDIRDTPTGEEKLLLDRSPPSNSLFCLKKVKNPTLVTPFGLPAGLLVLVYCIIVACSGAGYYNWPPFASLLYGSSAYKWLCQSDGSLVPRPPLGLLDDNSGSQSSVPQSINFDNGFSKSKQYSALARFLGDVQNMSAKKFPNFSPACKEQKVQLVTVYTLGFVASQLSSLVAGAFLDIYGPRKTAVAGLSLCGVGWLLLSTSSRSTPFLYHAAMLSIGASVSLTGLPGNWVAALYSENRGLVLSLISASFDASLAVPYVLAIAWEHAVPHWSFRQLISVYVYGLVVPLLLLSFAVFPLYPPPDLTAGRFRDIPEATEPPDETESISVAAGTPASNASRRDSQALLHERRSFNEDACPIPYDAHPNDISRSLRDVGDPHTVSRKFLECKFSTCKSFDRKLLKGKFGNIGARRSRATPRISSSERRHQTSDSVAVCRGDKRYHNESRGFGECHPRHVESTTEPHTEGSIEDKENIGHKMTSTSPKDGSFLRYTIADTLHSVPSGRELSLPLESTANGLKRASKDFALMARFTQPAAHDKTLICRRQSYEDARFPAWYFGAEASSSNANGFLDGEPTLCRLKLNEAQTISSRTPSRNPSTRRSLLQLPSHGRSTRLCSIESLCVRAGVATTRASSKHLHVVGAQRSRVFSCASLDTESNVNILQTPSRRSSVQQIGDGYLFLVPSFSEERAKPTAADCAPVLAQDRNSVPAKTAIMQSQRRAWLLQADFIEQLKSVEAICFLIHFILASLRTTFVNVAARDLLGDVLANKIGASGPLACIACILFGKLVDKVGVLNTAHLVNVLGALMFLLLAVPRKVSSFSSETVATLITALYVAHGSYVYGQIIMFTSEVLGLKNLGKFMGVACLIDGLLAICNAALYSIIIKDFNEDFFAVNITFLVLSVICIVPLEILLKRLGPSAAPSPYSHEDFETKFDDLRN